MTATDGDEAYNHHKGLAPLLRPTGPKRFWTFFAINLAGFIVANAFWQYLSTGSWVDFTPAAYHRDLATPLGETLLRPLNIFTHPWMIVVIGLLLGVMILLPVVVAVLYRLLLAACFIAVVAIAGHAPVLAAALAVGCILAARTPLRSDMPFLAVLVGLVPVAVYLYVLGFADVETATVLPLQRWILRVPFLVGLVSALLSAAIVLALVHVTRFRPGVVWPVLAAFVAVPMVIFCVKIGPAELDHALIISRLAPGEAIFESTSLESWRHRNVAAGLNEQALRSSVEDDLKRRQRALVSKCEEFLAGYPASRRAPSILWIQAKCLSIQFDRQAFRSGWIRYTASYPLDSSTATWQRLRESHPTSPQAAIANWQLAELALRRREVKKADELLHEAADRLRELFPAGAGHQAGETGAIFSEPAALPGKAYYDEALFEVQRLIWLIEQNNLLNDAESAQAMAAYLNLNRYRMTDREYYRGLAELAGQYEGTQMAENLKLAVARATDDLEERVSQLIALARQWSDGDAAIEANYELGRLLVQEPLLQLKPNMEKPEVYFKRVIAAPPSPWQLRAAERVAWLRTFPKPKQEP